MKYACSIIIFFFVWNTCQSQIYLRLSGRVNDIEENPISGAIVSVYKDSSTIVKFTITGQNGEFSLSQLDSKLLYTIKFSFLGYTDSIVKILPALDYYYKINLKRSLANLKEVLVETNRKIIENGDTTIFNANDFGAEKEVKLEDLLRTLPGMQIDKNGNIKFKGKPISKVLIEGDDLFGTNYKLMTQSLGAYSLSKVEAIENDVGNPLLKNFISSKQTNLNIRLKKEFLFKIFSELTIKSGIDPRYLVDINTYSIAGKNKFSIIFNANKIGVDNTVKADVNSFSSTPNIENIEDNISGINLSSNGFVNIARPPFLTKELSLINNDYLVSGNYLRKLGSMLDLRTNIIAVSSANYYDQSRQTTFINALTPVEVKESLLGVNSLKNISVDNRFGYYNKKKLRIVYSNQLFFKNTTNLFEISLPLDTILPQSIAKKNGLHNTVNLTYKVSSLTTVDVNAEHHYLASIQNNINNTKDLGFKKIIGINQNEKFYYNSIDYYQTTSLRLAIYFKEITFGKSKLNISILARFNSINESFRNDLSFVDTTGVLQIGNTAFNLQNNFIFLQRTIGSKLLFKSEKWNFRFEPHLYNELIFQKTISTFNDNKLNYVYVNPNLYLKYKLKPYRSIEVSYVDGSKVFNYQDFFSGTRFTDYRSIVSSSLIGQNIPLIQERRLGFFYSNMRISKGTIFQFNLFFSKTNYPLLNDYLYSPIYSIENKVLGTNPNNSNSFLLFYEKSIPVIKSYISLNNFCSQNFSQSTNIFTTIKQKSFIFQNELSIRSMFTDQITTKFTYGLIVNIQDVDYNKQQFISKLSKLRSECQYSSKSKKILLKIVSEHYWFNGKLNGKPFLSVSLSYSVRKNKILFSILGNNLLNNTHFSFFNLAPANSNQQRTTLQQRLMFFGVNFKF